jgi:hypothetical protein
MTIALAVTVAIVTVAGPGIWYGALWRGWRHAAGDQTPSRPRIQRQGAGEERFTLFGRCAVSRLPASLIRHGRYGGMGVCAAGGSGVGGGGGGGLVVLVFACGRAGAG